MPTNRSRRTRATSCDLQTLEFLSIGENLLAFAKPYPENRARADWLAHKDRVIEWWVQRCAHGRDGIVPTCWAARVFDQTPQIALTGLSAWQKNRIARIELYVEDWHRAHPSPEGVKKHEPK